MAAINLYDKYGMVVDSGKEIFRENEVGNVMFIIQEGSVRITKTIDGKPHILSVLGKGDFFGEMAIVTRVKRTATATAAGTVRLLSFDREGFLSMIAKNGRIALNIIDKLCRRLQAANAQIQHLVKRSENGMIGLNLYYAFAENGMEQARLDVHKISRDMSINLAISQENIIIFIKQLEKTGSVALDGNVLILKDRAWITSISESSNPGRANP